MPLRVLGIAGSLRRGSYNRSLLRAAVELAPKDMEISAWERLAEIPLYDGDVEAAGHPEPVVALDRAMREADAILFATPEYNHGIPGVLKNAIDWTSRPASDPGFGGKPVGIMGATPGTGATIRAQVSLRQSLSAATYLMGRPEVLIARAGERFDAEGRLTDEPTRKHLAKFLEALSHWARRFSGNL
jgi:chromate reductase